MLADEKPAMLIGVATFGGWLVRGGGGGRERERGREEEAGNHQGRTNALPQY